jgi:hypothetical protein
MSRAQRPQVGVGGPADLVPASLATDRRWADDDVVSGAKVVSHISPGSMRDEASGAHPHVDLEITGMTCASCVRRVEQALEKVDGVVSATVNLFGSVTSCSSAQGSECPPMA